MLVKKMSYAPPEEGPSSWPGAASSNEFWMEETGGEKGPYGQPADSFKVSDLDEDEAGPTEKQKMNESAEVPATKITIDP